MRVSHKHTHIHYLVCKIIDFKLIFTNGKINNQAHDIDN